jgi:ssRNA-specific RNase YbeY (16S rRNA maturation enzyme)
MSTGQTLSARERLDKKLESLVFLVAFENRESAFEVEMPHLNRERIKYLNDQFRLVRRKTDEKIVVSERSHA